MPVFFQQDIDADTRLAIWHITEAAGFFDVPLQKEITHPHKRLQHLAGRYLLRHLFPSFPLDLIRIADTRKPFLENEAFHFSISHCGDYAAVLVSRSHRAGIDLEIASEKVERIRHKFIGPDEEQVIGRAVHDGSAFLATLVWSCKEAVFKWYGWGGIDFRAHIEIKTVKPAGANRFLSQVLFKKEKEQLLSLHSQFFGMLCLSYVVT